jgi:uncharacterized Tic20 family protein
MEPSQETLKEILNTLKQIQETLDSNPSPSSNSYKIVLYLVPIFGIVFGSGFLFSIFYWWHKQRIEMIRFNLYKPFQFNLRLYSFFLGLLLTFTGFVLSLVFIMVLGNSLAMLGGLLPLAVGLSLLTFYKFEK